ncbi:polysaccharide biosynthesis protein [Cohnella sp. GCM10027633]|uniref:polysaccharide biosynthesis protein n=1 Tax=unclassified Cohnella TaxID=2636738 RepID=UPI00364552B6
MGQLSRTRLLMLVDAITIACSIIIAFLLRFDLHIPKEYFNTLSIVIPIQAILTISLMTYFRIYKRLWQYASTSDVVSICKATVLSSGMLYIIHHLVLHPAWDNLIIPRSIHLLSCILIILCIVASRFFWKIIRDDFIKLQPHHKRVLVIGAGNTGVKLIRDLKQSDKSDLFPVVCIDDDVYKRNLEVHGVPVVGGRKDIAKIVDNYEIDVIVIAIPSATKEDMSELVKICKKTGKDTKIVPRFHDFISSATIIPKIREVRLEDLLGREQIRTDLDEIMHYIQDRTVLVTGAGGSIGSELCRQILNYSPRRLILLGHGENSIYEIELELRKSYPGIDLVPVIADIQDKKRLEYVFKEYEPKIVFHAAAHKHVPLMEKNPIEAVKNNVFGTMNLAETAHQYNAHKFVMISTDKAVNPTNVMGATKRIAEMIIQGLSQISNTKFVAVRFGNVLGSRGSVVPIFKKQIEEGGPVTVTHPEMVRYFMTIPEAVQLVLQSGSMAESGEIYILDMGKPMKIVDLATDLIRLYGIEPGIDIEIKFTGIRPGEKLYEEILSSEEGARASKHNRIFISKPENIAIDGLKRKLDILDRISSKWNEDPDGVLVRQIIKEIVISYQYNDEYGDSKQLVLDAIRAAEELASSVESKSNRQG